MFRATAFLSIAMLTPIQAADPLPQKPYLNLAAIKRMVAAAEAEAQKRNVEVTLCIMDDNANILFMQKADKVGVNTIHYAERKARHAAMNGSPSKSAADRLKAGDLSILAVPNAFPNQGGLPIRVDGRLIGSIAASGAPSEVDEAIAQAGIDALVK